MAPPADLDDLTDEALLELYGRRSFERGEAYADEDRVQLVSSAPGSIKAACNGSNRASYLLSVRWHDSGGAIYLEDTCSCPLGGACKHCVAAIITARRRHHTPAVPPGAGLRSVPSSGGSWRRALAELAPLEDLDASHHVRLALQFFLEVPRSRYAASQEPRVMVRPMRLGRSGRWIKTGASWRDIASPYGYDLADADPAQLALMRTLLATGKIGQYSDVAVVPLAQFGPDLWFQLARASEIGMAFIDEHGDGPGHLSASQARPVLDLTDDDGYLNVTGRLMVGEEVIPVDGEDSGLVGAPPHGLWMADEESLRLIPFDAPLNPAVARIALGEDLIVPPEDVDEFLDLYHPTLVRHAEVGSSDGSVTVTTTEFAGFALVVDQVSLGSARLEWSARYRRGDRTTDYGLMSRTGPHRDRAAEASAIAQMELPTHLLPGLIDASGMLQDTTVSGMGLVTLVAEVLPWLESKCGVAVDFVGGQPELREASEDPLISLRVSDGEDPKDGNDWFDLDITVTVDGEEVDFVPLFAALNRDEEVLFLPSGRWLRLDRPEFDRLRELIEEARGLADPAGSAVARVNRFQAGWWDELASLGVVGAQSQRWAESVARMADLTAPEPVNRPPGLEAELRQYQQEGLDWLVFLHRNRLGGILADDMGLGKTVQTLALCLHVAAAKPTARFLVVAPTSVVDNWAREAARFAPDLPVATIGETANRRGCSLEEATAGASIVVTSYALFRLEFEAYDAQDWDLLLLDEAQFVKNHQGKTYQCARRLEVATKIAITGTPLENTLMDLWSLLSITAPGLYPDPKRFSETYRKPIERGDAPELLATLRRRIAPLMRRRTKDAVLTELPPKTEQTVEIELGARHARIYQTQLQRQRQKVLGLVGDMQKHRFEILKSLTVLRQLALDPGLVDEENDDVGSAKLDRLLEDLSMVVAEGHRALVFSQFTRYLARVRTRLDAAGIDYAYLDGRTRRRDEAIARFKDGDAPVFVISLKAGGFGLNLTEADYCFILDPWWNPATETQAVDRTHRMGQLNPVMVYRYVSAGTIEEKVMELKARKANLFSSVMDADGTLAGALSADDIRGLLDLG